MSLRRFAAIFFTKRLSEIVEEIVERGAGFGVGEEAHADESVVCGAGNFEGVDGKVGAEEVVRLIGFGGGCTQL